ncbi:MAG: hypothetical protein IIZ92_24765, partial [Aquincola sp.]|nr:hypothetical protein [Aquincola sp.]
MNFSAASKTWAALGKCGLNLLMLVSRAKVQMADDVSVMIQVTQSTAGDFDLPDHVSVSDVGYLRLDWRPAANQSGKPCQVVKADVRV